MMDLLLTVLFTKSAPFFMLGITLYLYLWTKRKGKVFPFIYWGIGIAGYAIMVQWTTGWMQLAVLFLEGFCFASMLYTVVSTISKQNATLKRIRDRMHRINTIQVQLLQGTIATDEASVLLQELRREREEEAMIMQ